MRQTTPCPPCPNRDCQQPHVVRNGHMSGHQRYHCLGCGAWFGETQGTPLYRLRTPVEEIAQALLLVMRRGSFRAAEEVSGHKYETIGTWLHLAARHAEALTQVLVHDLQLSTVEVDEFWSFVRRRTAAGYRPIRRRMVWPPLRPAYPRDGAASHQSCLDLARVPDHSHSRQQLKESLPTVSGTSGGDSYGK